MARTIGKKNTRLVKELVAQCRAEGMRSLYQIEEEVLHRLPKRVLDTWEMAWQEIVNIVWDERSS